MCSDLHAQPTCGSQAIDLRKLRAVGRGGAASSDKIGMDGEEDEVRELQFLALLIMHAFCICLIPDSLFTACSMPHSASVSEWPML